MVVQLFLIETPEFYDNLEWNRKFKKMLSNLRI